LVPFLLLYFEKSGILPASSLAIPLNGLSKELGTPSAARDFEEVESARMGRETTEERGRPRKRVREVCVREAIVLGVGVTVN
jgi:hypothetical protein